MNCKILRMCTNLLLVAVIFVFATGLARAAIAPPVSGSYEVVRNTALGSEVQIRVRIHLVNHGPSDLIIQRMTLWDFSHADKGGSRACALTLHAHASAETTQEFTIPRSDYQLWHKGLRPRFVLQMAGPANTKSKAVVRLDRISGQEAK